MPYRVDRNTLRTNQAFIAGLPVLGFILGTDIGRWLVLFVGLVMLLGTIHPAFALFKQVHQRFLKPRGILGPDVHAEDPMPHQFAQGFGSIVALGGAVALFAGATTFGWALAWIVIALALVNLAVQFCAGCFVYYQLDRFGLLPKAIASSRAAR